MPRCALASDPNLAFVETGVVNFSRIDQIALCLFLYFSQYSGENEQQNKSRVEEINIGFRSGQPWTFCRFMVLRTSGVARI